MKTLYLLRHAKAEAGGKGTDDRDRALNARGRDAADEMGKYLKEKNYLPTLVLCSPSARTRETLARLLKAAGAEPALRYEDRLYLATSGDILNAVHRVDDGVSSLMVVGHNPGMHHAALLLASPERTELRRMLEIKYPTSALAALTFGTNRWRALAPGQGALTDFITPAALPD